MTLSERIKHYSFAEEDRNIEVFSNEEFILSFIQTTTNSNEIEKITGSIYGFLNTGSAEINCDGITAILLEKTYFVVSHPNQIKINPGTQIIYAIWKKGHTLNTFGGPIEAKGRLKYIDGCSDTILIYPSYLGQPCLNYLHFPQETNQTMHSHPSFRFGIINSGNGKSISLTETINLNKGDVFFIPADLEHNFNTFGNSMDVIAFHPDSDWGPTDEVHPMINRTWVDGSKIK